MIVRGVKMKSLLVNKILNSNIAVDKKTGDLIFDEVERAIENRENIIIDFSNIDLLNTAFLNNAIGKIYLMSSEKRKGVSIKIANFPLEAMDLLEEVINTAKEKASIF